MREERMTANGTYRQTGSGPSRQEMAAKAEMQLSARRASITRARLELAIAEAVRSTLPECRALIGVIVERVVPGSPGGVNWIVKGRQIRQGATRSVPRCHRRLRGGWPARVRGLGLRNGVCAEATPPRPQTRANRRMAAIAAHRLLSLHRKPQFCTL
jgi:hypothetical protein